MIRKSLIIAWIITMIWIASLLDGCKNVEVSKTLKVGTYPLNTVIRVQDNICLMPNGEAMNGVTRYNTGKPADSTICVSLKSDDPHRTAQHELCHACHLATGADVKVVDR